MVGLRLADIVFKVGWPTFSRPLWLPGPGNETLTTLSRVAAGASQNSWRSKKLRRAFRF